MDPAAIREFAQQSAATRAYSFGGCIDDGTADAHGNNLQIGERKFRGAFTRLSTLITDRPNGKSVRCSAAIMVPRSLGINVGYNTIVTHIPTGDEFEVVQVGIEHPNSAETRVLLHRREP